MAIYQYYLEVVPKKGVEKKHGFIPDKIGVNTATGFFESDAEIYWRELNEKTDKIDSKIDLIVNRANWGNDIKSFNWKTYTEELDNDASIFLDEESMTIVEFSFRADLREKDLIFLKNMVDLVKEKNWMLMDRKGKLMNPDFNEIKKSIKNSNGYKFLKDPLDFIENIK